MAVPSLIGLRRLASKVPVAALCLLLAMTWLSHARNVLVKLAGRCSGPEGISRMECRLTLVFPSVVAVYSLLVIGALWLQEVYYLEFEFEFENGRVVGGGALRRPGKPILVLRRIQPVPPANERAVPVTDADAMLLVVFICVSTFMVTSVGSVFLLLDLKKATTVGKLGYLCTEGGFMGFSVAICILVIPFLVMRLMRLR